ncbi:hypothetical protein [Lysobacter changpingensis]|uniref:hypothetical protein n=1 Tax=Lysobacter changpingensis TaxID=2792784 RepID=UPI001A8E039A|nr:hypothetical protein [Lysobacter changpingensis]
MLLLIAAHPANADRLMAQYPIAAVEAGFDPVSKSPVYELVVAGLALPEPASLSQQAKTGLENCTRYALGTWGSRLTDILADPQNDLPYDSGSIPRADTVAIDLAREYAAEPTSHELSAAAVTKETKRRIGLVDSWLRSQPDAVRNRLHIHCGNVIVPEAIRKQARLLISLRRCPVPTPREDRHPCNMKGLEGSGRIKVREYGYTQLYAWSQSRGARPHDEWWHVGAAEPGDVVPAQTSTAPGAADWPKIDEASRLRQFEALVQILRKRKESKGNGLAVSISSSVPTTIGLTQESAARVIDLIQSPMYAASTLPRGNQALLSISDEVARTRIVECVRLKRLDGLSLGKIASCSGYVVTDADIGKCLTGDRCMPAIATGAMANVLQITESFDVKKLASNTRLPRVSDVDFDTYELVAKQCALDSQGANSDERYQQLAMQCTLKKVLNSESSKTLECITRNASDRNSLLSECVAGNAPGLVCYQENASDLKATAWCAARSEVPPDLVACIEGYRVSKTAGGLQSCALRALGGDAQRAAEVLECTTKHKASNAQMALCMAGPSIPENLRGAAECAQTNSDSMESFATCSALKEVSLGLGGDLGRLAACAIQAQGDPLGTGVCVASPGLNPSQQILLQCAVASGGEPITFATCSGGRLALQEFIQCKNVRFADGNCFGRNNEIRRFVRALGLPDIGPNSVVADIADKHLDVLKFQVRFAEDAFEFSGDLLEGAGDILEGFGKGIKDIGDSMDEAISKAGGAIASAPKKVWKETFRKL